MYYFILRILFAAFQFIIGKWADKTFPQSNLYSMSEHLTREANEVKRAIDSLVSDVIVDDFVNYELADVFLILLHMSHRLRRNLIKYAYLKHKINKKRKWGKPDKDGVVEHIRETVVPGDEAGYFLRKPQGTTVK